MQKNLYTQISALELFHQSQWTDVKQIDPKLTTAETVKPMYPIP